MLIDSHHHLWSYSADEYGWISDSMSMLRRDFLLDELRAVAAESHVDGFVSVQARQSMTETEDLLRMAALEPLIRGVVGWVPLADPEISQILDQFADQPLLKGVRHVVQDEPDDRFLLGSEFNRGVAALRGRGLVYDVLIFARQLPATIEFVDHHDDVPMVLDHIAKPTIRQSQLDKGRAQLDKGRAQLDKGRAQLDKRWESDFRELAKREHLSCKFSGVVTEVRDDAWSIETIRPYWDVALEAFTPKRLMFGSDWPVCLLRTGHHRWLETVRRLASELSAPEQADLFANTATRVYQLSDRSSFASPG